MVGILNIDKPGGLTSFDVVSAVRHASGASKVGHAGTLDPLATGVLLVCVGRGATRVAEYLMDHRKAYQATFHMGVTTDTHDAEGEVIDRADDVSVSLSQIGEALQQFLGRSDQVPPMYSALKKEGRPLYELAREGVQVQREARPVVIYNIEILDWSEPFLELEIECGRGTYIRGLARDLGQVLGYGAHLKALTRLAVGRFDLDHAESMEIVQDSFARGYWQEIMHPIDEALLHLDALVLEEDTGRRLAHGHQVEANGSLSTRQARAYSAAGEFIALVERQDDSNLWQPVKVFAPAA